MLCVAGLALTSWLSGTTTTAPFAATQLRYTGEWSTSARVVIPPCTESTPARTVADARAEPSRPAGLRTAADDIRWLHASSGLTWEQLGRAFGVSRRAVHHWANGGRLNAANAEILAYLVALVGSLPAHTADHRRALLLAPTDQGPSVIDRLRSRQRTAAQDALGNPFAPEELVGALHGEPEVPGHST